MEDSNIQSDIQEHCRQMVKFHKSITLLTLIFIASLLMVSNTGFEVQSSKGSLVILFSTLLASIFAYITYAKAIVFPDVLTGYYGKVASNLSKLIVAILSGVICYNGYVVVMAN
ncbi:hypothetical protein [Moritella sp. F3]|uniref:hypothetical protein n=1 Tax=Moritella sp. F3 TaxID=2718882 RepID=UPI0018E1D2AA|nr:hypothetical protein [Moritella sp. F3]GIC77666.1 hypothetical protein FMO001_23930 [Moritella sp. F1]GIC82079.1 hypothetical protein FMO003_23600 [Moritella sp. F3]